MSLAMTKEERETFLADLHVGIISIPEEGRGPLTVPIWYLYEPYEEMVRVVRPARTARDIMLEAFQIPDSIWTVEEDHDGDRTEPGAHHLRR